MSELSDSEYLLELARVLDDAERMGAKQDAPEGARYVQLSDVEFSDTLARTVAERLREIAAGIAEARKGGEVG